MATVAVSYDWGDEFESLEAAVAGVYENYGDGWVDLIADYTLVDNLTIPAGIIAVVDSDDTFSDVEVGGNQFGQAFTGSPYVTLTIPQEKKITIGSGGALIVGGQQSKGAFGKLVVEGSIEVQSGGKLFMWGEIVGSEKITAYSGATVCNVDGYTLVKDDGTQKIIRKVDSEKYKYLLYQRLRRNFSMDERQDAIYTRTFFANLFDASITVDDDAYHNFVSMMDTQLDYVAENNAYNCQAISNLISSGSARELLLIDAFAAINVKLTITRDNTSGTAKFVKPNTAVMTYEVSLGINYFYVNSRSRTEYQYAKSSNPYYELEDMDVIEMRDVNHKMAGIDTYWSYSGSTLTISGNGIYMGVKMEAQIGTGTYTTLIIGAEVSALASGCVSNTNITKMVLLTPADGTIKIDSSFKSTSSKYALAVYTDCADAKTQLAGITAVTVYSLSAWGG